MMRWKGGLVVAGMMAGMVGPSALVWWLVGPLPGLVGLAVTWLGVFVWAVLSARWSVVVPWGRMVWVWPGVWWGPVGPGPGEVEPAGRDCCCAGAEVEPVGSSPAMDGVAWWIRTLGEPVHEPGGGELDRDGESGDNGEGGEQAECCTTNGEERSTSNIEHRTSNGGGGENGEGGERRTSNAERTTLNGGGEEEPCGVGELEVALRLERVRTGKLKRKLAAAELALEQSVLLNRGLSEEMEAGRRALGRELNRQGAKDAKGGVEG